MIERLHESIAAVCPIIGVSVPTSGTSVGVRIDYDPSATVPQQVSAQSVLATFDWSQPTHTAWITSKLRDAATTAVNSGTAAPDKLIRALLDIIRDEINLLRGLVIGEASAVFDPANMANGSGVTSPSITVTGAVFGDYVEVAAPYSLQGILCTGYVSAADTVQLRLHNATGGAINLASGTWKACVRRDVAMDQRTLVQLKTAIGTRIGSGSVD